MKRGFLKIKSTNGGNTKGAVTSSSTTPAAAAINIPITNIQPGKDIPTTFKFTKEHFPCRIITVPHPRPFVSLSSIDPPSVCLLYAGARESFLALPDFPAPYILGPFPMPYSINPVPCAGLGMVAAFDLKPGALILRERPMIVFPVEFPYGPGMVHPEELFQTLVEKLCSSSREFFTKLHNCKGSDHSTTRGIVDTNALDIGSLPGMYDGHYGAVCWDLSRINHR
jgi:hypothetical protein